MNNSDEPFEVNEIDGNKFESFADGSTRFTNRDGKVFTVCKDGNARIEIKNAKSIGIKNIMDLKQYSVTENQGIVKHKGEFKDNGTIDIEHTLDGNIVSFNSARTHISISAGNEIMISARTSEN